MGLWDELLEQPLDPDRVAADRGPDGGVREATVGVLLAQALHHGSDHRGQVCAVLTSLGVAPPAVDAFAHGTAIGKVRFRAE